MRVSTWKIVEMSIHVLINMQVFSINFFSTLIKNFCECSSLYLKTPSWSIVISIDVTITGLFV